LIILIILYHIRLLSLLDRSVQNLNFRCNWRRSPMHFWIHRWRRDDSLHCRFL